MQKINHTGLNRFFSPTFFSNVSVSYSISELACSISMQSHLTSQVKPFSRDFEIKNYSDDIGAEVFPIRIVHEPDEILGFNSRILDSTISEIGEIDFIHDRNSVDRILCLYLPHSWGNRPSTQPTRQ